MRQPSCLKPPFLNNMLQDRVCAVRTVWAWQVPSQLVAGLLLRGCIRHLQHGAQLLHTLDGGICVLSHKAAYGMSCKAHEDRLCMGRASAACFFMHVSQARMELVN